MSAPAAAKRKWAEDEEEMPPQVDRATRRFNTPEEAEKALGLQHPLPAAVRALFKQPRVEQKSPEWFLARQCAITASDMSKAIGRSRQYIMQKKVEGSAGDNFTCAAMEWGRKYEDCAAYEYEKRTGYVVLDFGLLSDTQLYAEMPEADAADPAKRSEWFRNVHADPQYETRTFLKGSPDGIAVDPKTGDVVLLEIKCPFKKAIFPQRMIREYYAQVQTLMHLTGLTKTHFVQYHPAHGVFLEQKFDMTVVERNESYIKSSVAEAYKTWQVILELRKQRPLAEADPSTPRTPRGTWLIPRQIFTDVPKYKFPACVYVVNTKTKKIVDADGNDFEESCALYDQMVAEAEEKRE